MNGWPWVIAVAFLLAYEAFALKRGKKTLSRMMSDWEQAWPFFDVLVGMVVGGLLVHFFWHWCP